MKEFNFIPHKFLKKDIELFFGPIESNDIFVTIEPHWTMANILVKSGVVQSTSEARRQGKNGPMPTGFSDMTVGNKGLRRRITIFNC